MRGSFVVGALLLAGCATYAYVPEQNATGQIRGQPAADYAIPPEAPQGDVRIASFGVTDLATSESEHVRALHLRMVVSNNGAVPWTVDTREQLAAVPGEGHSRPIFASTDDNRLPLATVAPGGKRTLDLVYPLPASMQKAKHLPAFDVVWRVDTGGGRVVAMRTPFERVTVEPAYAYGYGAAWEPYWWYDPFFFGATFAHPIVLHHHPVVVGRPVHYGYPPSPVIVHQPPVVGARPVYRR